MHHDGVKKPGQTLHDDEQRGENLWNVKGEESGINEADRQQNPRIHWASPKPRAERRVSLICRKALVLVVTPDEQAYHGRGRKLGKLSGNVVSHLSSLGCSP